ncbi:proteasome assembly chaperone family protein [Candidatus Woesearchaeota archaeon]|nr:proteasome assembly chaperone family protein [Candidatus Woesearchaeota archaeon]
MKINLTKKPKNPTIIEGFPGFGLIGTISTEFLIDQLKAECIGTIKFEDIPAMVAIHDGKVVHPIGIFYDQKTNILIVHVITNVQGLEWELADAIAQLAKQLAAKEVISLEGVATPAPTEKTRTFCYTNNKDNKKKFSDVGIEPLREGIIIGVTGALLLQEDLPISAVFVETHSALPDSKASAQIIEVLDKYLGLKLSPKPLLEQAEKFEQKIKSLVEKSKMTMDEQKKKLSYVG